MSLSANALITLAQAKTYLKITQDDHGQRFPIATKSLTTNVATLTTKATSHGLAVNDVILVSIGDSVFDGSQTITVIPASNQLSFAKVNANVSSVAVTSGDVMNYEKDTLLETLIEAASENINDFCNRKFKQTTYTDYYSPKAKLQLNPDGYVPWYLPQYLQLNHFPLISITGIYFNNSATAEDTSDVKIWDVTSADALRFGYAYHSSGWPTGARAVKIVYSAGYATVPFKIQQVSLKGVMAMYWESGMGKNALMAASQDGASVPQTAQQYRSLEDVMSAYEHDLSLYRVRNVA